MRLSRRAVFSLLAAAAAVGMGKSAKADLTDFTGFAPVNNNAANGGSYSSGSTTYTLTNGMGGEASSGFGSAVQDITGFNANFTYTATNLAGGGADGAAFIFQNDSRGTTALGDSGGSLGYGGGAPIAPSGAIEFNIYNTPGSNFANDGITGNYHPVAPVNLKSGDPINVNVTYDGSNLSVKLTDSVTNDTITQTYNNVPLPTIVGGNTAYVGFSGGTGGSASTQTISGFSYHSVAPTAPPLVPIGVTGFNQDLVVENGATSAKAAVTGTMDGGIGSKTGDVWYERGFNTANPTTGLPSGTIVTQTSPMHSFTMQPFTGNNAFLIGSGTNATETSGTLTLNTPKSYSVLSLLGASGGGGNGLHLVVHHADGAPDETTAVETLSDWFGPSALPTIVISNGRVNPTNYDTNGTFDNVNSNNPRLYQLDFSLSDTTDPISSVDIVYDNGGGRSAIFAISGIESVPEPATLGLLGFGALGLLVRRRRA